MDASGAAAGWMSLSCVSTVSLKWCVSFPNFVLPTSVAITDCARECEFFTSPFVSARRPRIDLLNDSKSTLPDSSLCVSND